MNRFSFLYLVTCYSLASIFTLYNDISLNYQIIGSLILIAAFGIPHGAIDNILLQSESQVSNRKFYVLYVSCILIYVLIWAIAPLYSFYFFLFISAYHFGESQLANYKISESFNKVIYLFWGTALMTTLFHYNKDELIDLFQSYNDTKILAYIFKNQIIEIIFYLSNFLIFISFIVMLVSKQIDLNIFKSEIFQLLLIHITFYLFPVIISFTLYFVFLHSLKVLTQEYSYLNARLGKTNLPQFLIMLAPHTILSLFFIAIFVFMSINNIIDISVLLFSIISISVITLPHSIVMANFYKKFK